MREGWETKINRSRLSREEKSRLRRILGTDMNYVHDDNFYEVYEGVDINDHRFVFIGRNLHQHNATPRDGLSYPGRLAVIHHGTTSEGSHLYMLSGRFHQDGTGNDEGLQWIEIGPHTD